MQIELSAEARLEIASLVYSKWAESFDAFKAAKTATWESTSKFCPKGDWPLFKASRIKFAQKQFDKWTRLKAEMCKYSPLIIGK